MLRLSSNGAILVMEDDVGGVVAVVDDESFFVTAS